MTHADRVREAESAVVEAAAEYYGKWLTMERPPAGAPAYAVLDAVAALLALRAETCPECGGAGSADDFGPLTGPLAFDTVTGNMIPCPAGCDAGRRRDRT